MFINNVTGDANNTEGFGSIYSFKLISYALSEIYKIGFVNNEMRNIVGGGYVDMSQEEYDKTVNDYFDLDYKNVKQVKENPFDIIFNYSNKPELIGTEKIISRLKRDFILNSFNRNINKIMSKEILSKLGKGIPESSNSKYFKEGLNIVIHLRAPLKDIDIKFAEDPELTNVEYLTPSHWDHFFSNTSTFFDWVKTIFFFCKIFFTSNISEDVKLLSINGWLKFFILII